MQISLDGPFTCKDIKDKNVSNGHGKLQLRLTRVKNVESKKRGCLCRFNVKQLYYVQDIAEVVYYNTRHAKNDGLVVHVRFGKGIVPGMQ